MLQMCCKFRNWWTRKKSSSPKQMGRRKVLIFSYLLFRGYTCNFSPNTRTEKMWRYTQGSFHSSAWFCYAQIKIVLIHTHTGQKDWINIGGNMHLTYADSLWMLWKWPRRNMAWIFNPYFQIRTRLCIFVNTKKQVCPLAVQFHLMLLESNLTEE